MSTTKWLLFSLMVLAINNILLVSWINRGSDKSFIADQGSADQYQGAQLTAQDSDTHSNPKGLIVSQIDDDHVVPKKAIDQSETENAISEITATDQDFIRAFSRAGKTDELAQVLLEVQMRSQKLYQEIDARYATMSSVELLAEYNESDSSLEKQTALTTLISKEFNDVEPYELKALYETPDLDKWARAAIIQKLVSGGDPDGMQWAKQSLEQSQGVRAFIGTDILSDIYQHEPDFVKEYISNVDLDDRYAISGLSDLFYQEQELAKEFVGKNFDDMLQSDNRSFLQLGYQVGELNLDRDQQQGLINALVDSNRNKRDFALRLLNNVKDTDLLRDGYQSLERDNDRINFLSSIYSGQRELARELAQNSDNSKIQRFAR